MNPIHAVETFTEAVGQTTNEFNVRQTALYCGLQLEELAEKMEAIGLDPMDLDFIRSMSKKFKIGHYDDKIAIADREQLLDADIDLAWVTIGSGLSQGADVMGAFGEVAAANLDKLVPCPECGGSGYSAQDDDRCDHCAGSGRVSLRDANGKVKKPDGWKAPVLSGYVCIR